MTEIHARNDGSWGTGMRRAVAGSVLAGLLLASVGWMFGAGDAFAQNKTAKKTKAEALPMDDNPFPNRSPAPSLDGGKEWLNCGGEITLKDVKGKVVLLDFWTYCCINCMHVLPDLKKLEHKYANQLVVIGVHSAKFDNEKETENIRRAIVRYEIEHPVVNDANMTIWRKFGVNSWPTMVLIDPEGNYCGYISGEGNLEVLEVVLDKVIKFHRAKKTLDESPLHLQLEKTKTPPTPLRFPGKILADEAHDRLFISDSNHNRIVIASLDGQVQEIIGTGAIGAKNGAYDVAQFDHPQGMALDGDTLYVADTENHMLRAVDLVKKTVATIAGVGEQARGRDEGGPALGTALNSPWDLLVHGGKLYIAMAGPHQIWTYDPETKRVRRYAGSGREDILNGDLKDSAFAQPSGFATDGKFLYVADSEGSSIRQVPFDPKGDVTTVVGTYDLPQGRCLFEFGDRDGIGDEARLQHPLGLAYHEGTLFVADSYNHKIKRIDLKTKESKTYLGTGTAGAETEPVQFSEPAGLAIAAGKLYVADTNNHAIRVVDLATKKVTTLELAGLTPPSPPADDAEPVLAKDAIQVPAQVVKAGEKLTIEIALKYPEGYKLNKEAPVVWQLHARGPQGLVAADQLNSRDEAAVADDVATFSIPLAAAEGEGTFQLSLSYPYCRDGVGGLCKLKTVHWNVPLKVDANGAASVKLTAGP